MNELKCPYCNRVNDLTDILKNYGDNLPLTLEWTCDYCEEDYYAMIDFVIVCKSEKIK